MTSWADVQRHMRGKYRLQDDQPDMMSMVWSYDDGRMQKIIVRRYQAAGREMLEFKSPFARKGQVEAQTLLEDNAKLPLATVALSGDVYLVIYNVLVENLVLDDFDFVLSRVAAVADTLRTSVAPSDRQSSGAPDRLTAHASQIACTPAVAAVATAKPSSANGQINTRFRSRLRTTIAAPMVVVVSAATLNTGSKSLENRIAKPPISSRFEATTAEPASRKVPRIASSRSEPSRRARRNRVRRWMVLSTAMPIEMVNTTTVEVLSS